MIASMPMYDLPEVVAHTDQVWNSISRHLRASGVDAPEALTRSLVPLRDHWVDPALLFSHTCGFPAVSELDGRVAIVGSWATVVDTPDQPGWYQTRIVAREDDPRADDLQAYVRSGLRLAANGPESLSGWISLSQFLHDQHNLADALLSNETSVLVTGSHVNSLLAVQSGEADVASIDPWSCWLFEQRRPSVMTGLRTIGCGPRVAITPLITHFGGPVDLIRAALIEAVNDPEVREHFLALGITGFVPHGIEAHDPVREIAARCEPTIGLLQRRTS
jgi:ABC-type phosphate/phosphonate transport system substrate-binding protein